MTQSLKIIYRVAPDAQSLARIAAQHFVDEVERAVAARGIARIAISGGSTPKVTFEALADPAQPWFRRMPWTKIDLWWVDERCVPPAHPDSNYHMTRESLLDRVPLPPEKVHRIQGELEPETAAARFESELRNGFRLEGAELPCFDAIQLGMGSNGHTASLFPHSQALREFSRLAAANHVDAKEAWRVTLTSPVINHGSHVFFLISGADKAQVLKDVFIGPRDPERLPSQMIRPAGGILALLLDRAAAALLPEPDAEGCGVLEREI
jgi:6-phosphogluconolactonase